MSGCSSTDLTSLEAALFSAYGTVGDAVVLLGYTLICFNKAKASARTVRYATKVRFWPCITLQTNCP